jgi:hypothetical protein
MMPRARASSSLSLLEHGVERREVGRRRADEGRAGRVAAIAALAATDVEDEGITGLDHALARIVMRAGRVGAGRDDRKVGGLVAVLEQEDSDPGAHVGLGPSTQALRGDRLHGRIGRLGCLAQPVDLVRRLDSAQGAHRRPGLDERRGIQRRAEAQHEARPHLVLHRDARRAGEQLLHEPDRIVGLVPGDQRHRLGQLGHLVPRERLL